MINKAKILYLAKGFRGRSKNVITVARYRVTKALQHAYVGRKNKKRDFRALWIQRINAGTTEHGVRTHRIADTHSPPHPSHTLAHFTIVHAHKHTRTRIHNIHAQALSTPPCLPPGPSPGSHRPWPPPPSGPASPPQVRYNSFIHGLQDLNVQLNRKVLAELALNEPFSFKALAEQVKFMRGL